MATVSSLGVGSGIDLQSLVDGLVSAEQQQRLIPLDAREARANERISAYGLLKSSVSLFNDALSTLGNISTFQARNASSSDESAFTVSAAVDAALGSYSIEVLQAGQAQVLTRDSFVDVTNTAVSSADTAIGGGTLTIQLGDDPAFSVVINSANSSLNDIVTAINGADGNTGVEASVINADSGPVLIVSSVETGTDNEITISVDDVDADDSDAIGLSQLTFDPLAIPTSNLTQQTAAQDAQISVNGQTVTSADGNTFANVVTGVTITALAETTSAGTATISKNTQAATDAVNEFVENFNSLIGSVNELGRAGTEDGVGAGVLVGDSVLRSLTGQIRRTVFTAIDTTQPEGVRTLSDIGISIQRDGTLQLNGSRFADLLESNFDDVARLLAADGDPIAQNQQLQSVDFDAISTAVGEGQLQISVGETTFNVDISAGLGNNTVQGIRDAINAAVDNAGVTASIVLVDDGAGGTDAQLLLTANGTGEDAQVTVVVDDNDGNDTDLSGLSQLASENLSEVVASELDAPEGIIVRLQELVAGFLGGNGETGAIDARTEGLSTELERIADERAEQERRIEAIQARLVQQFSSLDLLVANLQSSGDFLLSQLNSISQISTNRPNSANN